MPKFFVPCEKITEDEILIDTEDVLHIKRVLRLGEGDIITVCDGRGIDYQASIASIEDKQVRCRILSREHADTEPNIEVTLFQGIPKAAKMDYIIQKTTELGIVRIVPCELSRCVAKIKDQKKIDRWQKIAKEAAKQSGRGVVPQVESPVSLDEAIRQMKKYDISFTPYECEENGTLRTVLTQCPNATQIAFLVGPEGGFDPMEAEKIRNAGISTITLGRRILRTETAGEAVLAMVMYELGDINL